MAPLFVGAAFIERAVEIAISAWRDTQTDKLSDTGDTKKAHAKTKAAAMVVSSSVDPGNSAVFGAATIVASAAQSASDAVDASARHKANPNNTAFAISLTLGLLLANVGGRVLSSFCPQLGFQSDHQQLMFNVVDLVLSAALLAGGANGIHSVVSSITTFFDSNAQKEEELWRGCITGVAGK
jgi:hypothetical protein